MKKLLIAMPIALSLLCAQARADEDAERESLARISNEIARLEDMVKDASVNAAPAARIRFQYEWLIRDLQLVRAGIDAHVDSARQPRPVAPLKGDYRQ